VNARSRRAFTVTEITVAMLIFGLILAGVWALYASARRQAHKADVRLQGVKTALFLLQPLERDFRSVYIDGNHPIEVNPEGRRGLAFHVFDDEQSSLAEGRILTKRVTYLFAPNDLAVYRQEGTAEPRRIPGIFQDLVFKVEPTPPYLTMPPYTATVPERPTWGGMVGYLVSCLPIEFASVPPERWKPQDSTTIMGSLYPEVPMGRRKYHFWAFNPTSLPRN